jgi:osmotically-inducible protein OsmY
MQIAIRTRVAAIAVAALLLSACGPVLIGAGVAIGLRTLSDRSNSDLAQDGRIRVLVNAALSEQAAEHYPTIGIQVFEGRVMLTGTVPEESDARHAAAVAEEVEHVREVINEIQIGSPGGVLDYAHDIRIANTIRLRMIEENEVGGGVDIELEVVNRVAYLIGIAQDREMIDRLGTIVGTVSGVEAVVLHLLVSDDPARFAS